ncbi:uncharacterized protein LOC127799811 [Diospyros lotus]|uniref:uncharacterized protein LOC127799811 n=1 Tax=Diospyros lotus TaxID=55363 RepID=UPI00225AE0FE|nr:uncharacterized protein LOC127799811 [Diospyros lotus]
MNNGNNGRESQGDRSNNQVSKRVCKAEREEQPRDQDALIPTVPCQIPKKEFSPWKGTERSDVVVPIGRISLPFTIGDADPQTTTLMEFLIIGCLSAYNVVLRRPTLNDRDLVTSTTSLTIKFPTSNGKGTMSQRGVSYDLDPHEVDCDRVTGLVEKLEDIPVDEVDEERCLKLGKSLTPKGLREAGHYNEDMVGIALEVMLHKLNVDPTYKPVRQKRRPMTPERYATLKEKVDKLLANEFIREAHYSAWVANPILVKKRNGKWRTCIDFTDLNKTCPKDIFPLPKIDQLMDVTVGHQLLSFMDAYSGYNQIPMNLSDEDTSFITNQGLYCYKVMPFGLKNVGATY